MFGPEHAGEIAIALTGIATALLGVPFKIPTSLIESMLTAGSFANLATAIMSGNAGSIGVALGAAAAASMGDVIATLSSWQLVGFSLAVGGLNIGESLGSAGIIDAGRLATAAAVAATAGAYLIGEAALEWQQYSSS